MSSTAPAFPWVASDSQRVQLYDFQAEAVDLLRQNVRLDVLTQILAAPTGSGKTECAMHLIQECIDKGRRAVFAADQLALVGQTSRRLDRYGIPHGIVQGQNERRDDDAPVQLVSIQTIGRRRWPEADLYIIDEAHTKRGPVAALIKELRERKRVPGARKVALIGLTATPFAKGMGLLYNAIVSVTTTERLIRQKFLSPYRIFNASQPDMTGAKVSAGEWTDREAETRSLPIIGDIVAEYLKWCNGQRFIAFCATISHCQKVQERFMKSGVNCALYTADTPDEERELTLRQFRDRDGTLMGLLSCTALAKGFDEPGVECIIFARPLRRSLSEHIQMWGRGLRIDPNNPDKVCIARGSLILCQRGLVPIQELTLSDRVWDGVEFVSHGGAICNGVKHVITYAGLTATPDHLVKTAQGWRTIGECAREQIGIAQTGLCGAPVREGDGLFAGGAMDREAMEPEAARPMSLQHLRERDVDRSLQPSDRQDRRMRGVQSTGSVPSPAGDTPVADDASAVHVRQVQRPAESDVCGLWRSWYSVPVQVAGSVRGMDTGQYRHPGAAEGVGVGPGRQREALRTGQHTMGNATTKQGESPKQYDAGIPSLPAGAPRRPLRRQYAETPADQRLHVRRDRGAVQPPVVQAEREVWDILNCGPRNRFTAQGLLVHNCTILDFAGNVERFWPRTEHFFRFGANELDDGTKKPKAVADKKEAKAIKCPQCKAVHAPRPTCPTCGFSYPRTAKVRELPGELREWTGSGAVAEPVDVLRSLAAQLAYVQQESGRKLPWAQQRFRELSGGQTLPYVATPVPPTEALRKRLKYLDIKWAKGQQKRRGR